MKSLSLAMSLLCGAGALVLGTSPASAAGAAKPNIIFILCDDLGYGDVGVLYQNSRPPGKPRMSTPQLDAMAAGGMILRQHYTSSPVCAPARASLLLGQHQGDCSIRNNQFDKALPHNHTLGTVLQEAGYYTGMIGKYGLAGKSADHPAHPLRRGFDEFYGVLGHGDAHFHYPGNSGKILDGFTPVTSGLESAYDTDLYAARAKKFIIDIASASPRRPFFLYLAFTAPHMHEELPAQAYPSGRGLKGGLRWPLNTGSGRTNSWYHPDYAGQNWPDVEKRHATMIRRVDDAVGDIRQLLRDLDLETNTLVIFTSDNGPHNEDGQDPRFFDSWGKMDGIKRDLWEAGVREPTIISWPGHVPANMASDTPSCFWDWMPTFAELGGLAPPAQADGVSLVPTLTGVGRQRSRGFFYFEYEFNFKPQFAVDKELFARKHVRGRGQLQSIRIGDFTAVRYGVSNAAAPFRLYNVVTDPHEDHNLAGDPAYAGQVAQAEAMVRQVRRPDPDAPRPYDKELVPATAVNCKPNGMLHYAAYEGNWPWVPDFDALSPVAEGETAGLDLGVLKAKAETGLSFKGFINVPTDGDYTFSLQSDAGAQMWIDQAHVIDDDFNHTGREISASIRLQAGLHPIHIFYRHKAGTPQLSLQYAGPGLDKQPVPPDAFLSGCPQ
jgi:arylsulfatase A-like enzyme